MTRALLFALALAACSPAAPPTPEALPVEPGAPTVEFFPQWKPTADRAEMQALARGALVIVNGCLRVMGGEGAGSLVIWPTEARVEPAGDRLNVRVGESVVAVGDVIEMSGGEIPAVAQDALQAPIPAQCTGPYWIAGRELRPAIATP